MTFHMMTKEETCKNDKCQSFSAGQEQKNNDRRSK